MSDPLDDPSATRGSLLVAVADPANHRAWDAFLARYGPMVRGWCRRWFPAAGDEMAHEVFARLVFVMRTYRYRPERGRFRGWLKTVTHNLMAELKRGAGPGPVDPDVLDRLAATRDLRARLEAEYDLELLERARERVRGRVETRTWTIYEATAERGRKPAEVARALGMKVGAVYQAKHSVLTALRREVGVLEACD